MMTVAGSDCSAGAGLQADMKAAHAMGAFALTAVTCVVSEAPVLFCRTVAADIAAVLVIV